MRKIMVVTAALLSLATPAMAQQLSVQDEIARKKATDAVTKMRSWTLKAEADGLLYTSPAKPGQPGVTLKLPLGDDIGGESLADWFKARVANVIKLNAGRQIHKQQGLMQKTLPGRQIVIYMDAVSFKNASGKGGDLMQFTGWATNRARGAQIAIETVPEQVSADDPVLKQSSDYISVMAGAKHELTKEVLAVEAKKPR